MNHSVGVTILIVSWIICVYLLTVLWRIHHVHESRAWQFIFTGLTLLMVECAIGAHLAYTTTGLLSIEELIFIAIMLAKAVCYAVGFTIWKHDIEWLRNLAKQRRQHMAFDEEDDDKPQQPEHPEHPPTPQPGGPKPTPQDDPQPPGDPQGPGKGGGGGGG